jgi:phage terminase small subunit
MTANLLPFSGSGPVDIVEPDWALVITDPLEQQSASAAWRAAEADMRNAGTLAAGNADALRRYALAVALHAQAARHVFEDGAVVRKGKSAVQMWNLWTSALEKAAAMCESLEAELGLAPRRRNAAGAAKPLAARKPLPADAYLPRQ